VLSDERYHRDRLTEDARSEFFETGARHVDRVFSLVESLAPGLRPKRALDFGCGVGRVLLPLAARCASAVGIDVSPGMLEEARQRCETLDVRNVELVRADDRLEGVSGRFDLVHSYIVFQHLAPSRQARLLERLVERLEDGGVGVVHCLYRRRASAAAQAAYWARMHVPFANGLANVLLQRTRFGEPFMQMNPLPPADAFEILQRGGCGEVRVEFTNHASRRTDLLGVVYAFRKAPGRAW
jgi:SAM-dependent methyltransferase